MANEKIIAKKQEAVEQLADRIKNAQVVLLTDYRGINVEQVSELRKSLREINSQYTVLQNNIIKRAFEQENMPEVVANLEGPTAVITSTEDYLATLKVIYNFTKENEFYKIKNGVVEGDAKTAEEIVVLAKLPSKDELLSKLAGVLLANISKLAVALDQVKVKKESEEN